MKIDKPAWLNRQTPPPEGLMGRASLVHSSKDRVVIRAEIWPNGKPWDFDVLLESRDGKKWEKIDSEKPISRKPRA